MHWKYQQPLLCSEAYQHHPGKSSTEAFDHFNLILFIIILHTQLILSLVLKYKYKKYAITSLNNTKMNSMCVTK